MWTSINILKHLSVVYIVVNQFKTFPLRLSICKDSYWHVWVFMFGCIDCEHSRVFLTTPNQHVRARPMDDLALDLRSEFLVNLKISKIVIWQWKKIGHFESIGWFFFFAIPSTLDILTNFLDFRFEADSASHMMVFFNTPFPLKVNATMSIGSWHEENSRNSDSSSSTNHWSLEFCANPKFECNLLGFLLNTPS